MADKGKRKKRERFNSPRGLAVYPFLHAADTKYKAEGVFRTKLRCLTSDPKTTALMELIDTRMEQAYNEAVAEADNEVEAEKIKRADKPYQYAVTEEGKKDTSAVLFSFKMKASGKRRDGTVWTSRPALFDSQGTPLPAGTEIGNNSTLVVNFTPNTFHTPAVGAGVTLRLNAAQVINHVPFGSDTAEGFGFEAEDDGFVASDLPPIPGTQPSASEEDDGDEATPAEASAGEVHDF